MAGDNKQIDRLPELTQNVIRSSHVHLFGCLWGRCVCLQSRQMTLRTRSRTTCVILTAWWSSNAVCAVCCLHESGTFGDTSNSTTATSRTPVPRVQKPSHAPNIYESTCTATQSGGHSDRTFADTVCRSSVLGVNWRNMSGHSMHRAQSTEPQSQNINIRYCNSRTSAVDGVGTVGLTA